MKETRAVRDALLRKELDEYGIYLEDLRGFLFNELSDWDKLAADANLSFSTIRNLAMGDTKRPQERTVRQILQALGFRVAIVPMRTPKIEGEIAWRKTLARR